MLQTLLIKTKLYKTAFSTFPDSSLHTQGVCKSKALSLTPQLYTSHQHRKARWILPRILLFFCEDLMWISGKLIQFKRKWQILIALHFTAWQGKPNGWPAMTINTVGRNPANQLRLVVYPVIYRVLYFPGGAGFLPSTVSSPSKFVHSYIDTIIHNRDPRILEGAPPRPANALQQILQVFQWARLSGGLCKDYSLQSADPKVFSPAICKTPPDDRSQDERRLYAYCDNV